jgi:hypothetical protein
MNKKKSVGAKIGSAVFSEGTTKVSNLPFKESLSPDGGALVLLFSQPLLDLVQAEPSAHYGEITIAVRPEARFRALAIHPRLSWVLDKAQLEFAILAGGAREALNFATSGEPLTDGAVVPLLCPASLLSSAERKRVVLTVAYRALITAPAGQAKAMLESVEIVAVV